jgi:hypothetical protein
VGPSSSPEELEMFTESAPPVPPKAHQAAFDAGA